MAVSVLKCRRETTHSLSYSQTHTNDLSIALSGIQYPRDNYGVMAGIRGWRV